MAAAIDILHQEAEDPKQFIQRLAPVPFTVRGVRQFWDADATGKVTRGGRFLAGGEGRSIRRFNVEEYRQRTGKWPSGEVDLQRISYWDNRGNYYTCGPEIYGITRSRSRQEAEDPKQFLKRMSRRQFEPGDNYVLKLGPVNMPWNQVEGAPLAIYDGNQSEILDGFYDLTDRLTRMGTTDEEYSSAYSQYVDGCYAGIRLGQSSGTVKGMLGPYKWKLTTYDKGIAPRLSRAYERDVEPRNEAEDPKSALRHAAAARRAKLADMECPNCHSAWTRTFSVRRHYVGGENRPIVFCYGHYTAKGDFEPDERPDGDLGGYDLTDDSDQCADCLMSTMTGGKMPGYVDEAEDPKQVFKQLPRAEGVSMADVAIDERRDAPYDEMKFSAMWTTPFIIAHRKQIRGCPAGTGRNQWAAIRDLVDATNKESKTKFYFNFQSGHTTRPQQESKEGWEWEDTAQYTEDFQVLLYDYIQDRLKTDVFPARIKVKRVPIGPYLEQAKSWKYGTGDERSAKGYQRDVTRYVKGGGYIPPILIEGPQLLDGRHRLLALEKTGATEVRAIDIADNPLVEAEDPKNFLKRVVTQPILVHCYMGKWLADRRTGFVAKWIADSNTADDPEFARWAASRTAFDFDEWEKHWGRPADREIDICDIGSWGLGGDYDPPEEEYRKEERERMAHENR